MIATPRILFVDDEEHILKALRRHFLDEPYEIHTASSGREGLKMLEASPMDVVVSDFRMPEMDGGEFLRRVGQRWPETVRLVLSGYADITALISAINEGAIFKFIAKPWQDDELKGLVREAVHKHVDLTTTRLLAEQTMLDNAELFLHDATKVDEIHERNLMLEQKLEELKLYHNAFQSVSAAMLMFDAQGRLIDANPAAARVLQLTALSGANLPVPLLEAMMGIVSGKIPPFEPHHVEWQEPHPGSADLSVVTDNLVLSGVIAVLR
jgi:response regulator RpfG family c-di-GMP phosphodiesterase